MLQQEYKIDEYGKEILLQDDEHQVMMEWEKPYMEACIDKLQPKGDVLEIGFGMGYSATAIQKYKPKQYYSGWHSELDGIERKQKRILVFTTYLNTIQKGGETEFYYQKQKIKPVAGKTIIFPPYWTHPHKGNVTNTTKYIITGWYTYVH